MSLFSPEEKEEFENVNVAVDQIEVMLPEKYHSIFKELIQAILSKEIVKVKTNSSDDTTAASILMYKAQGLLLKIRFDYPEYVGLATGLEKQYLNLKSGGFLGAYTTMDSHKGEWIPFKDTEKFFTAIRKEMKEEDKELYLSLPNKVTVYRAADVSECENEEYGFSWTLNQDIARKFATEIHSTKDMVILKAIVDKDYIAAYTNARKEEECIINTIQDDWDAWFEDIEILISK